MNLYPYYPVNTQQPGGYYRQYQQNPYISQQDHQPMMRQQPTTQELDRRVNELTRQNQEQSAELTRQNQEIVRLNSEVGRINEEIGRINQEIIRLNRNDELHTDRLNRLNQRVRTVERNLNIPFTPTTDGF
ncbi:hypothetical protein BTR23_09345 [Alkalihalophilus pseudofirmus]|nr:hypothetical protein BTR23_09345 [Alkalihalophilus pseudofirmus]